MNIYKLDLESNSFAWFSNLAKNNLQIWWTQSGNSTVLQSKSNDKGPPFEANNGYNFLSPQHMLGPNYIIVRLYHFGLQEMNIQEQKSMF